MKEELIKKNVIDHLEWDSRVDASNIKIEVRDRSVILSGNVANYQAKNAAFIDTWSISGVRHVENKLNVKNPDEQSVPADSEIKSSIEKILKWNPEIEADDIDISVNNGIVTLRGSVDAFWVKFRVQEIISNLSGINDIKNDIAIVLKEDYDDKEIAEGIVKALIRNEKVSAENINVEVEDGEVTLIGKVSDWDEYRAAINMAKFTGGVKEVHDKISIEIL